ncbi:hypothetical protein CR513_13461, partial [Mucuna pruriens]
MALVPTSFSLSTGRTCLQGTYERGRALLLLLEKVEWSSLSSWLRQKLLKPFRENYKFFKGWFFHVCLGEVGPNLLVNSFGYTLLELKALRKKVIYHSPSPAVAPPPAPSTQATTLSPALTLPTQHIVEVHTEQAVPANDASTRPPTPLMVVLDSPIDSPVETTSSLELASNYPLVDVVNNHLAICFDLTKAGMLGISGVFQALQNYVGYSLVFSHAVERKFGSLEAHNKEMAKTIEKSIEDNLKLAISLHDVEEKLNCYRKFTENLQDQLKVAVYQAKDHFWSNKN